MAKLSYKARYERAQAARNKAVDAVYAFAEHGNMRFSECLERATKEVRDAYETACREQELAAYAAVSAGRAYRSTLGGVLIWTR